MKISEQWLREWVATRLDAKILAERLTLAGLEVGSVSPVAAALDHVVVGTIVTIAPHPQADRLRVCQVDVGQKQLLTIVCGAENAAAGLKVPAALEGAVLPNGTRIAKAVLRGVESSGMLCSAAELGLEEGTSGLLLLPATARPGTPIGKLLGLDDHQLEIELTPNRGDCLSVAGLAREIAALTGARLTPAAIKPVAAKSRRTLKVTLAAKGDCASYAGRVIEGIDPRAATPLWMRERLRRSGVRSIHPVVDVTNYVMLELGQPMHAFDLERLAGGIRVRRAQRDEPLALLDDRALALNPDDLVIADDRQAVALAGIMGGQATAVGETTTTLFLESAWFRPEAIGTRARHYGLQSESSQRFERGVDPALQRRALERATALIVAICGGRAGPVSEARSARHLPRRAPILLRKARLDQLLGTALPSSTVTTILKRLGLRVATAGSGSGRGWKATPPSWRYDLTREVDLIEELARVHGYDKVPVHRAKAPLEMRALPESRITEHRLHTLLADHDYQEAITYSFVDPTLQALVAPGVAGLALANPIASDLAQMRVSLWPGLIKAALHNQNRQQSRVRLFEVGRRFRPLSKGDVQEQEVIAGLAMGPVQAEQWGLRPRPVDFFDVKGDIEALLALGGQRRFLFRSASHPALHPGQTAEIAAAGEDRAIGVVGPLHPDIQAKTGLDQSVILFEIELAPLLAAIVPEFREISRYPAVRRDLALILDERVSAQAVLENVRQTAGGLLVNLELFDEYRGEGIDSGRKSLALGLTFQDTSRTLNDEDVETAVGRVVAALEAKLGAQLRQ
jgi:phenylalanyl-tRNA synthetase beta chain